MKTPTEPTKTTKPPLRWQRKAWAVKITSLQQIHNRAEEHTVEELGSQTH